MKSNLVTIAAMLSIAIGLLAKADDTRIKNRAQVVGALADAE